MPFIDTKISCDITKDQKDLIKEKLGKAIQIIPGKSENWLMVGFDDQYSLYFKGEDSPKIAFVEVKLFGSANKSVYSQLTAEICNIYKEVLDIPADKIYIKYEEVSNWGWNGSNF